MVPIATITSVNGIRGYVRVVSHASTPGDIFRYTGLEIEGRPVEVSKIRQCKGSVFVCKLSVSNTIEEANGLRNKEICIPYENLPALAEDEYYLQDLVSCEVINSKGECLGTVVQICNYGAGDILEYANEAGKTEMIPLNKEFIESVEIEHMRVIIKEFGIF